MRNYLVFLTAATALLWHGPAAIAQDVSVVITQQELPAPPATAQQQPAEQIATPQPQMPANAPAPQLQVVQPMTYAVPTLRWGFLGLRLVPRVKYVRGHTARPARVEGPYYLIR